MVSAEQVSEAAGVTVGEASYPAPNECHWADDELVIPAVQELIDALLRTAARCPGYDPAMSPLKKRGFDVGRIAAIAAALLALLALLEEQILGLSPSRLVALAVLILAVSILV